MFIFAKPSMVLFDLCLFPFHFILLLTHNLYKCIGLFKNCPK